MDQDARRRDELGLGFRHRHSGARPRDDQSQPDDLPQQRRETAHPRGQCDPRGQEHGRAREGDDRGVRLDARQLAIPVEPSGHDDRAEVDSDILSGMSRTLFVRLSAGILALTGVWIAHTQNPQAPPQLSLEKIKDDLYVIVGDGGNVAVYPTNEGTILIDDKFERDYGDIMAKVKSVTSQPVKYVLNTHQHGDHTGGNEKMRGSSAEIISHSNARANMVEQKMPGLARVTFNDQTEVFLGGKEVRARYFGRGHTNGDVAIYFPALRVLHTGDLFTIGMSKAPVTIAPFIDYNGKGSAMEWTKT